ncbi:MAG TPA: hypothetical protein P5531_07480 [Bacteroidales bacterium]|nr:hypothetical protein [Bacteroidales bacterium]HSA43273.1 hypothetical protein [Bacteroidales bacterium]
MIRLRYTGKIFYLWMLALLPAIAVAQTPSARASLDTAEILIGQQVQVKLQLDIARGTAFKWPVFTDTLAAGIEVVSVSEIDTLAASDASTLKLLQQIRITSFDTGIHEIPPFPFFSEGGAEPGDLLTVTNELFLRVNTVPVDTALAIKDIKGVMALPLTFWEVFRWILAGLAVLIIALGVWYYFYRKRKNKPLLLIPARPALPPHLAALEALEKLRIDKLWQAGLIKEYHTRLTDIVRTYLEQRYHLPAPEMTTWEILEGLEPHRLPGGAIDNLTAVLQLADLVKFAKEQPLPTQHETSLRMAVDFVNQTREVPHAPTPMNGTSLTETGKNQVS